MNPVDLPVELTVEHTVDLPVELPFELPVELPVEPSVKTIDDLCEGVTIYHLAVENRDHEQLKKASKIDLETLDRDGESVLHYAAVNNDIETCKLLLELNPNLKDIKCIEGKTALDWAKEYQSEYKTFQPLCDFLAQ